MDNDNNLVGDKGAAEGSGYERAGSKERKGRDYFLPVSVLIAGIMISGSVIYMVTSKNAAPAGGTDNKGLAAIGANPGASSDINKISGRDVILGDPNAPVTLIAYGDYQCVFCAKFFKETEPLLIENYVKTGKARMIFRNFQFLGPESTAAAAAAECAKDQSKFWAYHDALYGVEVADGRENNGNLTKDLFVKLAGNIGMDTKAFTSCVDSAKYVNQVDKDTADAQALGVNSTPITYINSQQLLGALPYQEFADAIDSALKTK